MEEGLEKRLIGAAVLASLAVIFVPMLFEEPPSKPPALPKLPDAPQMRDFASEKLREEIPAIVPLAPRPPVQERLEEAAPPAVVEKTRKGLSVWIVQAASLSSSENADRLVRKLRAAKLPTPDPELVNIKGKRFYRVKVGPVVDKAEAQAMVDKVSAIAGSKAQVRAYP